VGPTLPVGQPPGLREAHRPDAGAAWRAAAGHLSVRARGSCVPRPYKGPSHAPLRDLATAALLHLSQLRRRRTKPPATMANRRRRPFGFRPSSFILHTGEHPIDFP
jgi:hypothetical protein